MKILMTGATGFVGQKLGLELVKAGHELVVISRQSLKAQKSCPFPCQIIEADLNLAPLNKTQMEALEGVEVVYNLMGDSIAEGSWTEEKQKSLRDSRILATQHLSASFKNSHPKVMISASAIGIYGHRMDEELNEASEPGTGFLPQLCQDWEAEARAFHESRVVNARIGLVISREGGILKELLPVFQAGGGGALAGGKQWMSWIHRDDLVRALIFVLEHEETGSHLPVYQQEEIGLQLSIKRQYFCREYLVDRNATQAAVRAGYSVKTARQQAAQIMANEAVRVFLNNLMHLREQSLQESAEYVVNSLRDIVGNAVASGNHREALRGLELLGKHYRLFTDDAQRTRYPMTDKRFS